MKIENTEKLPKYSTIASIVDFEIQDDEERKGFKTSFKNTKLPVTNENLEDIKNKRMLSDNAIHGFNILCRRQFEHVAGFQDPLLGETS